MNLRRITTVFGKALADLKHLSAQGAASRELDALTDGELLERFAQRNEEAAFAALSRRHGPMVLSVCRRVLCNSHDAEDAFQATFLVMIEKGHRLRKPELLGNWLYGVAYRTALHARQRAVRHSERDREAVPMSSDATSDSEIGSRELRRVLDEELHRLPQKYRAPLVLCYLEGKTNEEAARLLSWPSGSMSYRLARGRELLRQRVQARLAGLTALLPATLLADLFRPAAVSPFLVQTTVQAAVTLVGTKMAAAATTGVIPLSVRELMEATLRDLAPSRLRFGLPFFALCWLHSASEGLASGSPTAFGHPATVVLARVHTEFAQCEGCQGVGIIPQRENHSLVYLYSSDASHRLLPLRFPFTPSEESRHAFQLARFSTLVGKKPPKTKDESRPASPGISRRSTGAVGRLPSDEPDF